MNQACPQLTIYTSSEGLQVNEDGFGPHSLRSDQDPENNVVSYNMKLDSWLSVAWEKYPELDQRNTTVTKLIRTLWETDTVSDMRFRRQFGYLLKFQPLARRLAAITTKSMVDKYKLKVNPSEPIPQGAFFGCHLRTSVDARNAGWLDIPHGNFSAQTDAYISQAEAAGLHVIYVASGNADDIKRFETKAAEHGMEVTSKADLLTGDGLEMLHGMDWDQQALVDYEVLLRSSVFGGFVKSSFSFNIALTRSVVEGMPGKKEDPYAIREIDPGVSYDDGLSKIWGRDGFHELKIPRGMWP